MGNTTSTIYILKSEEDLIAHEKALFRNFHTTYPDYSRHFFKIIDNNRLRPNMPYESQLIYGFMHNGTLLCAGSFCINASEKFNVEEMGFNIDKSPSVAEGMQLYSSVTQTIGFSIDIYRKLFTFAFDDLLERSITTIYASCSEKLTRLYKYAGFDVIDSAMFYHEREYLLKMVIDQDYEKNIFKLDRVV